MALSYAHMHGWVGEQLSASCTDRNCCESVKDYVLRVLSNAIPTRATCPNQGIFQGGFYPSSLEVSQKRLWTHFARTFNRFFLSTLCCFSAHQTVDEYARPADGELAMGCKADMMIRLSTVI